MASLLYVILVFTVAFAAATGGPQSTGLYLLSALALLMLLNVFQPHLLATVALRRYAPGLITGLLLILPSALAMLYRAFEQGALSPLPFLATSAVVIAVAVIIWPRSFGLAERLFTKLDKYPAAR